VIVIDYKARDQPIAHDRECPFISEDRRPTRRRLAGSRRPQRHDERALPVFYADAGVRDFVVSKFASLTNRRRAAVVAFLDAIRELGDDYLGEQADKALSFWQA
jgi:hypothetical protein